jgi:hypothetical protein
MENIYNNVFENYYKFMEQTNIQILLKNNKLSQKFKLMNPDFTEKEINCRIITFVYMMIINLQ